ncbi:MAG: molybdate transport system ATP-binding protein [Arenicella sp.]|jgi:molybdate transport system ATP-binding protein
MSLELKFKLAYGDFNLDIEQTLSSTGVTALYGPSGSGKTSVLRAIAGLDKLASGSVKFNQHIWQHGLTFLPTHQRALAYVFQEPSLFDHLSVKANVEYGFKRVPPKQQLITPNYAIEALGLSGLLGRDTQTLSGGEKQRVAIARALCSNPILLLMDEPLSALDNTSKAEILPMLVALRDDFAIPIIYVSHSLNEVSRLADHLVLMNQGLVVASGDIQSMLTQLDLSLAQDADAESLIDAVVESHDEPFELTYLDSPVGRFSVLKRPLAIGEKVRLLIPARDVSITREKQQDTSILNIFPATIEQIESAGTAQVTVRLSANGLPLLARLTKKSSSLMNLAVGDSVYLQAKSVAIL